MKNILILLVVVILGCTNLGIFGEYIQIAGYVATGVLGILWWIKKFVPEVVERKENSRG